MLSPILSPGNTLAVLFDWLLWFLCCSLLFAICCIWLCAIVRHFFFFFRYLRACVAKSDGVSSVSLPVFSLFCMRFPNLQWGWALGHRANDRTGAKLAATVTSPCTVLHHCTECFSLNNRERPGGWGVAACGLVTKWQGVHTVWARSHTDKALDWNPGAKHWSYKMNRKQWQRRQRSAWIQV